MIYAASRFAGLRPIPPDHGTRMGGHGSSGAGRARHAGGGSDRRDRRAGAARPRRWPSWRPCWRALLATLLVVSTSVLDASRSQAASVPAPLTVSRPDTVGYPDVDLILGGVPGLGIGKPPPVECHPVRPDAAHHHQLGPVAGQPDRGRRRRSGVGDRPSAGAGRRARPGPPTRRTPLVGLGRGAAGAPGARTATPYGCAGSPAGGYAADGGTTGIAAAAASGVQHVFVVSTCAAPAPTPAPAGVVVDLLGIGPSCTGGGRGSPRPVRARSPPPATSAPAWPPST